MAIAFYDHMSEREKKQRSREGHFLCDNDNIRLRHLVDVTDIFHMITNHCRMGTSPTARESIASRYFYEFDFEYNFGIHIMFHSKLSPDNYVSDHTMAYGYCDPEEDLASYLTQQGIEKELDTFVNWYKGLGPPP